MSKIRILSGSDVAGLMDLPLALEAVEKAYLQKNTGLGGIWPMVFHDFAPQCADLDIKSGDLKSENAYGLKVVSWNGDNPSKGLPALFGTSLVFDLATGAPTALLNAGPITSYRTGAAAAIGAKYLAREDSSSLLMVGCGVQAPFLAAATLYLMPKLKTLTVCTPNKPDSAPMKIADFTDKVKALLAQTGKALAAEVIAETDIEKAVKSADIILTATPSRTPMIKAQWVKAGTHFSCIGADMNGKQEISSDIMALASVFGDDESQCFSVGECELPHSQGVLPALKAEIGQVISGEKKGRENAKEITVFDSTGIALQDIACAAALLKKAEASDIGLVTDI